MMLYITCNNTDTVSAPSAPRNLAINATSSTTLFASWEEPENPNGPIDVYNVYLQTVDDVKERQKRSSPQVLLLKNVSMNNISAIDLEKYTLYRVVVKAANKEHSRLLEGPGSNEVTIRTMADG